MNIDGVRTNQHDKLDMLDTNINEEMPETSKALSPTADMLGD